MGAVGDHSLLFINRTRHGRYRRCQKQRNEEAAAAEHPIKHRFASDKSHDRCRSTRWVYRNRIAARYKQKTCFALKLDDYIVETFFQKGPIVTKRDDRSLFRRVDQIDIAAVTVELYHGEAVSRFHTDYKASFCPASRVSCRLFANSTNFPFAGADGFQRREVNMRLIHVKGFDHPDGWQSDFDAQGLARSCCEQLEAGGILFFPGIPFDFPARDRDALLSKRQSGLRYHKNISFRPKTGELRGFSSASPDEAIALARIMKNYSANVVNFVERFLAPYANHYALDYASYRPIEEAGRDLSLHKRNDLLHVDAFPTRPTAGNRILRVFTNINPLRSRSWVVGENFPELARRYALRAGLDNITRAHSSLPRKLLRRSGSVLRIFTKGTPRTAYDSFMLHFHDWLKENEDFQKNSTKAPIEFPPGCTWLVYTDYVPHAVLSGQFALEQTFIVHLDGMVTPQQAPIRILERLKGQELAA
jgi:hypothetical protein